MRRIAKRKLVYLVCIGIVGCDELMTDSCGGQVQCHLEVSTEKSVYNVGESIRFKFTYWTSDKARIRLFDDDLCGLVVYARRVRFEKQATRFCLVSWRAKTNETQMVKSADARSTTTVKIESSNPVRLGPNNKKCFELLAKTGIGADGELMMWFADDFYFSFIGDNDVSFYIYPELGILNSEGNFSSKYMMSFSLTDVDGAQQIVVGRKKMDRILPAM